MPIKNILFFQRSLSRGFDCSTHRGAEAWSRALARAAPLVDDSQKGRQLPDRIANGRVCSEAASVQVCAGAVSVSPVHCSREESLRGIAHVKDRSRRKRSALQRKERRRLKGEGSQRALSRSPDTSSYSGPSKTTRKTHKPLYVQI